MIELPTISIDRPVRQALVCQAASARSHPVSPYPRRRRRPSQKSIGKSNDQSPNEELWENRIYSCLIVSPAGRVISDFRTVKEMLESMRDAIKAHLFLWVTGYILHRDISSNNIIIMDTEKADGFKGLLIDLGLAKTKDNGPSGARYQTGTVQFMTIEVLRRIDHTYRHDLESFFYVLLWLCVYAAKPPETNLFPGWEFGTFESIASAKLGSMTENRLQDIMTAFPEDFRCVKSLCLKIRSILFGDTSLLRLRTPDGDPEKVLYGPILDAFEGAIRESKTK